MLKFLIGVFNDATGKGQKDLCPAVFSSIKDEIYNNAYDRRYKLHVLCYNDDGCIIKYMGVKYYMAYNGLTKSWEGELS